MRVLLRVLTPLLSLAVAAAGVLIVIEVAAAWVLPDAPRGIIVPWAQWRQTLETVSWADSPVPVIGIVVGVVGLALLLIGVFAARRAEITLDAPAHEMTVTTSPRALARLVGRRVRAMQDVAGATVTASSRRISVTAQGWGEPGDEFHDAVMAKVDDLLDHVPLRNRPSVSVAVQERKGVR